MTSIYRYPSALPKSSSAVVGTIGNFDGVHLGHQRLLQELATLGQLSGAGAPYHVLLSFYPHPALVLGKGERGSSLSTLAGKRKLLDVHGVDALYLIHFTPALAQVPAEEFIERILFDLLGFKGIVVGPDAAVGRNREGTAERILEAFDIRGLPGRIVPYVEIEGQRVSSGRIRDAISAGEMELAQRLLGRAYSMDARVIKGDGRGSTIGFPTANLSKTDQLFPANGVYATRAIVAGNTYRSVTNVGVRPTFGGSERRVETHFIDRVESSLYGLRIEVEFVVRLREEQAFSGPDDLKTQIEIDISEASRVLGS